MNATQFSTEMVKHSACVELCILFIAEFTTKTRVYGWFVKTLPPSGLVMLPPNTPSR